MKDYSHRTRLSRSQLTKVQLYHPGPRVRQFRNSHVELPRLDEPVAMRTPRHGCVKWNRVQRERLLAAVEAAFEVASLDVGGAGPPPATGLQPQIVRFLPVLERAPAVL